MRPRSGQRFRPGRRGKSGSRFRLGLGGVGLALVPTAASAAIPDAADPLTVLATIATGAVALALAAGLWALAEQRAAWSLRRSLRAAGSRMRAALSERDALLGAGREALVVWGRDRDMAASYGGAERMLDSCLAGQDATALSEALDGLSDRGQPFALVARDQQGRRVTVRGRAVGGMAAVWLSPETAVAAPAQAFVALLDALPFPVWLRDRTLSLTWANRAFLSAIGTPSLEALRNSQNSLEKSERDLAATARACS